MKSRIKNFYSTHNLFLEILNTFVNKLLIIGLFVVFTVSLITFLESDTKQQTIGYGLKAPNDSEILCQGEQGNVLMWIIRKDDYGRYQYLFYNVDGEEILCKEIGKKTAERLCKDHQKKVNRKSATMMMGVNRNFATNY